MIDETKKYEAMKIDFHFESPVTLQDINKLTKKVGTFCMNTGYENVTSSFITNDQVTFVINFEISNVMSCITELAPKAERLINSHKQAATYEWSRETISSLGWHKWLNALGKNKAS